MKSPAGSGALTKLPVTRKFCYFFAAFLTAFFTAFFAAAFLVAFFIEPFSLTSDLRTYAWPRV